ncbi:MAG: hypothetical protein ABJD66_03275 [Cellulophaga sp.]|uniref:hypothetical protein n=1 Tax=Cellulophaga sp. TaxID=1972202 RepID=UPI00326590A1
MTLKKTFLISILILVFQNIFSQEKISTHLITKYIFSNDYRNVKKYSQFQNKKIKNLKQKLDSIEHYKEIYKINTDSLVIIKNLSKSITSDSIKMTKKSSTIRYKFSPKYSDYFKAGHIIELSYETYLDKDCNTWNSSKCIEYDSKIKDITIINNYLKKDFSLNNYFNSYFKENESTQANIIITDKFKTLISSSYYKEKRAPKFVENLKELKYQTEKGYVLNESSNIYIIYFIKGKNEDSNYFKIIFNPNEDKIIININEKFYIAKNPKIELLKKWISDQFKIK